MRFHLSLVLAIISLSSFTAVTSAHVVVKPNQAAVGQFQTFTMSVPVEKDQPTTALRLVIPDGLQHVTPNVKPGWKITLTETEITWSGGLIPVGQRDEFMFSAQVPATPATLAWKAYQTYQDGTVVAWDQSADSATKTTPYSVTKIIDDVQSSPTPPSSATTTYNPSLAISSAALVLALIAIGRSKPRPV